MMNLRFVVSIVQMFFASVRSSSCGRHDRSETDKVVYVVNQISKKKHVIFSMRQRTYAVRFFPDHNANIK